MNHGTSLTTTTVGGQCSKNKKHLTSTELPCDKWLAIS